METTIDQISNLTISASDTSVELQSYPTSCDVVIDDKEHDCFSPPRLHPPSSSTKSVKYSAQIVESFYTSPPPDAQHESRNIMGPPPPVLRHGVHNVLATHSICPGDAASVIRRESSEKLPSITSMMEQVDALPGLVSDSSIEEISTTSSSSSSGSLLDKGRVLQLLSLSKANVFNVFSSGDSRVVESDYESKPHVSHTSVTTNTRTTPSWKSVNGRRSITSIYRRRATHAQQQSTSRSFNVEKHRYGSIARVESFFDDEEDGVGVISETNKSTPSLLGLQIPQFPFKPLSKKARNVLRPRPSFDNEFSSLNGSNDNRGNSTCPVNRSGNIKIRDRRTIRENIVSSRWNLGGKSVSERIHRNRENGWRRGSSIRRDVLCHKNEDSVIRLASLVNYPILESNNCQILVENNEVDGCPVDPSNCSLVNFLP